MINRVFNLNESQISKLEKWQSKIKKKFGNYGEFTYSFTPTGIGDIVKVYSNLLDETIDLSEYENW